MLLHHRFIEVAKNQGEKLAFIDRTAGREVTYSKALIASLLLAAAFKKYDKGFLGVMIPTSAGCGLSILGSLMSGCTPVMINYSTGAEDNCRYAQNRCDIKTIVTWGQSIFCRSALEVIMVLKSHLSWAYLQFSSAPVE